jgi:hypothetical protein
MELLSTDKDTFPTLVRTLPRNVMGKKKKHGLCDRLRAAEDDYRDHEVWYVLWFSHEHTDEEMCQRQKNDDISQQSRTLVTSQVSIGPIDDRRADLYCLVRAE